MTPLLMDDLKLIGIYAGLAILVYLLFRQRKWTEPARAMRLEALEDGTRILRGNFHRFERDTTANMRDMQDCLHNILGQVQTIRENGAHEHPLEDKIDALKDRVDDLEQAIHGLPCGQHLSEACPPKEK